MNWFGTFLVAVGGAIVGAVAGGLASYKVQRRNQLRDSRMRIYMDYLLPFHAEVERLRGDVATSAQPVTNDLARNACRSLFRVAVTSSDSDTAAVESFAQQLEPSG